MNMRKRIPVNWIKLILEYKKSNISVKKFCFIHEIPTETFYHHLSLLTKFINQKKFFK